MEARMIQPSSCQGKRSYPRLRRRQRPNQAKVRSTTQRRCCTVKPVVCAGGSTMSRSRLGQTSTIHWAKAWALYARSAHSLRRVGTRRLAWVSTPRAPGPSAMCAGWTCTASRNPFVSTTRCRLRPLTFFPPVNRASVGQIAPFNTLTVDDGGGGPASPPLLLAYPLP